MSVAIRHWYLWFQLGAALAVTIRGTVTHPLVWVWTSVAWCAVAAVATADRKRAPDAARRT